MSTGETELSRAQTVQADRAATAFSVACILHCLALPLLASAMPFFAAAAEAEWVHWGFAVLAIAISGSVPLRDPSAREPGFLLPAGVGVALVAAGLFADSLGADETVLTVIGGCLIAFAHMRRLFSHR